LISFIIFLWLNNVYPTIMTSFILSLQRNFFKFFFFISRFFNFKS